MKEILKKWLGIDECATYYQHCEMIKQIIQLQKLDKKVLKKSPFKQEYESFLEIQKKLFKHV